MANPFQQWYHADFLRTCKRKKLNFAQKSTYAMFLHELWECQGYLDSDPYELAHQLGLKSSDCLSPFASERLSDPSSVALSIATALLEMGLIQKSKHPETGDECYYQERILEDMGRISQKSKVNSMSGKIGALVKKGVIVKSSDSKGYVYKGTRKPFIFEEYIEGEQGDKKSEPLSERLEERLSKGAEAYHNHNHNHIKNKEIESVGSLEVYGEFKTNTHAQNETSFISGYPNNSQEVVDHAYQFCGRHKPFPERCIEFYELWLSSGWEDSNGKLINWKQKLTYFLRDYQENKPKEDPNQGNRDFIEKFYGGGANATAIK